MQDGSKLINLPLIKMFNSEKNDGEGEKMEDERSHLK